MEGHYGKYRAVIKDVHDPERLGRVRVYCPAIYGEEWSDWAYPNFPPQFFCLPPEDSTVWVEFEDGNPEFPIWTGVWYDREAGAPGQVNHDALQSRGGEVDHDKLDHEPHPIDSVERKPFRDGKYYDPHVSMFWSLTGHSIIVNDDPKTDGGITISDRIGNTIKLRDDEKEPLAIMDCNGNSIQFTKEGIFMENTKGVRFELSGLNIYGNSQSTTFESPSGVHLSPSGSNFTEVRRNKKPKSFYWRTKEAKTDPTIY